VNPASANATTSACEDEPVTVKQVLSCDAATIRQLAMDEDIASLIAYGTWSVEPFPDVIRSLPCKWVFKINKNARGHIERYKARLLAKGYQQVASIDYDKVYAPVSKHSSLGTAVYCFD
jgi:Reverse transcriptase (RNA-dependent DNA polymerase)